MIVLEIIQTGIDIVKKHSLILKVKFTEYIYIYNKV